MAAVNTHDVTPELARIAKAIQAAGWTWRRLEDDGGPSGTKMGQLLTGEGRVRNDVLRKLEEVFDWPAGTGLSLVATNPRVRRGALTRATVRPPGQGRTHERGPRRGKASEVQVAAAETFIRKMQEALDEFRAALDDDQAD